jgi:hypothetical protein
MLFWPTSTERREADVERNASNEVVPSVDDTFVLPYAERSQGQISTLWREFERVSLQGAFLARF